MPAAATPQTNPRADRSILKAAVYGAAVGDALGVSFEFRERGAFACTGMVGFGTHLRLRGRRPGGHRLRPRRDSRWLG